MFLVLICSTCFGQIDSVLISRLDSMVIEDQKWRGLITQIDNNTIDSLSREAVIEKLLMTDSLNYFVLSEIFANNGFLGYDKVGKDGSHKFWLLMQHQDGHPEFQKIVLGGMKIAAEKNNSSFVDYAYLVDRVLVNTEELQIYGTQMTLNEDESSYVPKPVIEPNKLNERRKQARLGTIESYINTMNTRYFGTLKK